MLAINIMSRGTGLWRVEVASGDLRAEGEARGKKAARREAAKALLAQLGDGA